MAIRLTVVLSQPAAPNRHAQDLADELVAQLLGRPAMDLGLIGPLESVAQAPTDRLMLDGLSGDFAILAWSDAEATIERLRALGIQGGRAPHSGDPDVAPPAGRRIYCYDGRGYRSAADVVTALAALLKDRQVVTFNLAGLATPQASAAAPSAANASHTGGSLPAADATPTVPRFAAAQPPQVASDSEEALDALVDDLNALDL